MSIGSDSSGATILRPAKQADAEAVWRLLKPAQRELTGMTALPGSLDAAATLCAATAATTAELATGSFELDDEVSARMLFVA